VEKEIYNKRLVVVLAHVNCRRWTFFNDRWQPSIPYVGVHRSSARSVGIHRSSARRPSWEEVLE